MRYLLLTTLAIYSVVDHSFADESLKDYMKTVERDEWEEIYEPKSRKPVIYELDSKEANKILASFMPIFVAHTPAKAKLVGKLVAYKNWALFSGYSADSKGEQITPKGGDSSDVAILFLRARTGWTAVDYGLGITDMGHIIWPAVYGSPVELFDPPKPEQKQ